MKSSIIFLIVMVIGTEFVYPLRLKLVNSVDEIIAEKKIAVKFEFEQDDMAVYNDSIRFSVDSASVELKNWKGSLTPVSEYIPLFRSHKLVYMNAFNVDIALDFTTLDREKQRAIIQESNLYLACLTLSKGGKNRSKNLVVALAKPFVNEVSMSQTNNVVEEKITTYPLVQFEGASSQLPSWQDDTLFNKFFEFFSLAVGAFYEFLGSERFIVTYISLFFMVCFFLLMRMVSLGQLFFYNVAWKREVVQFVILLWLTCNFYFLTIFISMYMVLFLMALFFLVVGFYYLQDKYHQANWLSKIRTTLGMLLITLVLPILVKAYLLKNALLK